MKTIFDVIKEIDTAEDAHKVASTLYDSPYFSSHGLPVRLLHNMDSFLLMLNEEVAKEKKNYLASLPEPNEEEKNNPSIVEAIKAYRFRTGITSLSLCKEAMDFHRPK